MSVLLSPFYAPSPTITCTTPPFPHHPCSVWNFVSLSGFRPCVLAVGFKRKKNNKKKTKQKKEKKKRIKKKFKIVILWIGINTS